MNRITIGVIGTLLLALGLTLWGYQRQVASLAVAQRDNQTLTQSLDAAAKREKANRALLKERERALTSEKARSDAAERALWDALQANKSWSDTDVPPEVRKALDGAASPAPARL